jgi:hypothetical protein
MGQELSCEKSMASLFIQKIMEHFQSYLYLALQAGII